MDILINLLIFCLVLFLYIHINNFYKTSNYAEIYTVDNPSKESFEEMCEIKQPLLMKHFKIFEDNINSEYLRKNCSSFEIKMRTNKDVDDINKSTQTPILLGEYFDNIANDASGTYISENNSSFLEDTNIEKTLRNSDMFLRPYNISNTNYDIIMGSTNSYLPLRYNLDARTYLFVTEGSIEITLAPPESSKFLHVKKNYESLEMYSQIDINNVDPIYANDFNKIKFVKIILNPGSMLYIPPYWFYSIKILSNNTIIFSNNYRTFISTMAILPELCIQFLQKNNLKITPEKIIT